MATGMSKKESQLKSFWLARRVFSSLNDRQVVLPESWVMYSDQSSYYLYPHYCYEQWTFLNGDYSSSQYPQLVFPCFPLSTGAVLSLMEIRDNTTRWHLVYYYLAYIRAKTKKLYKHFEFAYFSSSYSLGIETINTFIHSRSSLKNHTHFSRPKWAERIPVSRDPFSDQNGAKPLPDGTAHTYITYIREYYTPPD